MTEKPDDGAVFQDEAEPVSAGVSSTAPATTPAPTDHPSGKRGRGGAPLDNLNAAKDPAHAALKRERRLPRRERRDRHRRAAERETTEILEGSGLADHPLVRRIGVRLTDVATEVSRLRDFVAVRGRFNRDGSIKPAYQEYLRLQREDRVELRYLLGELAGDSAPGSIATVDAARAVVDSIMARFPGAFVHRALFEDGSALDLSEPALRGTEDRSSAGGPTDAPASEPATVEPVAADAPVEVAVEAPSVPSTLRELLEEPTPAPPAPTPQPRDHWRDEIDDARLKKRHPRWAT